MFQGQTSLTTEFVDTIGLRYWYSVTKKGELKLESNCHGVSISSVIYVQYRFRHNYEADEGVS